jgi:hypothetical protein
MGMSPYIMVYEKECLPVELEQKARWAIKQINFDLKPWERKES